MVTRECDQGSMFLMTKKVQETKTADGSVNLYLEIRKFDFNEGKPEESLSEMLPLDID